MDQLLLDFQLTNNIENLQLSYNTLYAKHYSFLITNKLTFNFISELSLKQFPVNNI